MTAGNAPSEPQPRRLLRVVMLSDGIPGHFRQSEGIVAALARRHEIALQRLELPARPGPLRWLLAQAARFAPRLLPLSWHLGRQARPGPADVVISAGGRTLAANVALTRRLPGACNIFSGSPRAFGANAFSRVLLSYPAPAQKGLYVLKPTALDPGSLPPPRAIPANGGTGMVRIALLVGGPTAVCAYDDSEWRNLLACLEKLAATPGIRLLPVTSRRTPDRWSDDLLALAKTHPAIEKVIDYRVGGTGSITEAFSCDAMLVTADSMSMITEGVAARRPVAVLEPAGLRPSRDTATVADLERQGRLARIPLAGVRAAQDLLTALSACRPMTENHLERLADLLEPVLPARTEEKR